MPFRVKKKFYVCTTADIWSSYQRLFFLYPVIIIWWTPWKGKTLLKIPWSSHFRKNRGNLEQHLREYGIHNNKIVLSITDNGSNFCEA